MRTREENAQRPTLNAQHPMAEGEFTRVVEMAGQRTNLAYSNDIQDCFPLSLSAERWALSVGRFPFLS